MKRILDIVASALGLVILAPLFLVIALANRLVLGRPVWFRQTRPGLHGKPFELVKFRTMKDEAGPDGRPLPDDQRMTRYGTWLRRTSLDELPELWNVLRGDMSLVGPRPLLMEYLPLYSEIQARRHDVRPGLTGWSQVHGRNDLDWEERLAKDVWYVANHSLWLDLMILFRTVGTVFLARGVNQEGQATMVAFRGTSQDSIEKDQGSP